MIYKVSLYCFTLYPPSPPKGFVPLLQIYIFTSFTDFIEF